jgi:hypothetical protein
LNPEPTSWQNGLVIDQIRALFNRTLFSDDYELRAEAATDMLTGAIIGIVVFGPVLWKVLG